MYSVSPSKVKVINTKVPDPKVMYISTVPKGAIFRGRVKGYETVGSLYFRVGTVLVSIDSPLTWFEAAKFDVCNKDFEILDYEQVDLEIKTVPHVETI